MEPNIRPIRIGVAIPCYKRHIPILKRLLDSIEKQTRKPDMVIVSCSSSKSQDIPYNMGNYSFPFKIIVHENRLNAAENRNIAGNSLDTDIISFIDADDEMHPQRLEIIETVFTKYDCELVVHNFHDMNTESDVNFKMLNCINCIPGSVFPIPYTIEVFNDSGEKQQVHRSQSTIRKVLFNDIQYPEDISIERMEDSRFCYLVALRVQNKCMYIADKLSKYYPEGYWYDDTGNKLNLP